MNDNTVMAVSPRLTRRSLANKLAGLFAAAAAAPRTAFAQTAPADPDMDSARDAMKANMALIAKVKLPMATEPACHFKA